MDIEKIREQMREISCYLDSGQFDPKRMKEFLGKLSRYAGDEYYGRIYVHLGTGKVAPFPDSFEFGNSHLPSDGEERIETHSDGSVECVLEMHSIEPCSYMRNKFFKRNGSPRDILKFGEYRFEFFTRSGDEDQFVCAKPLVTFLFSPRGMFAYPEDDDEQSCEIHNAEELRLFMARFA